jgi:Flp pilus assembly protein TadD
VVVLKGLRPLTRRLVGGAFVFPASMTFFWAALTAGIAVLTAWFESPWLAYGLSAFGGFFVGMMVGSLNPNHVRNEDAWMMASLPLGIVGTVSATWLARHLDPGSVVAASLTGAVAGGLFLAPMSALLARLWDEAHALLGMAKLFLHNDNFASKAVAYLDNAIRLDPENAEFYNLRGIAWSKMDEPEKARADWQRVAELEPQDPNPHLNCGVDHLRRNELNEAVRAFETALALDPENATAHTNLGAALEKLGDLDRAIEEHGRAIAIRPDYALAFSNRAHALLLRGECEEAVADCEHAFELDSRLAIALVNRGHALQRLRDLAGAGASYRAALEMEPSPEVEAEALSGLQTLDGSRAVA